MRHSWSIIVMTLLLPGVNRAPAQQPTAQGDSLRLSVLWQQTLQADPRQRQIELSTRQTDLRLRNLDATWLPSFRVEGLAQYQSDVPQFRLSAPGQSPPTILKSNIEGRVAIQQQIYDPSLRARRELERAQLAESQARVQSTLFNLRDEINDAFFNAALLQDRAAELSTVIEDLEARRREAATRAREGTALPSEAAALEAAVLQRRQDLAELTANQEAALTLLEELTLQPIRRDAPLALPDVAADFERARCVLDSVRARPEYEQFAATRERLRRQANVIDTQDKPQVSAFGRVGYGRPGLDFLNQNFDTFWLGGVQVQWTPWNWGRSRRDREELELQREIVTADEQAFVLRVRRSVERDLAAVARLQEALALDNRIVALRERIERETRARFEERVVTSSEYIDRRSDLTEARFARALHRVELAQAQTRFLTILGLEVR